MKDLDQLPSIGELKAVLGAPMRRTTARVRIDRLRVRISRRRTPRRRRTGRGADPGDGRAERLDILRRVGTGWTAKTVKIILITVAVLVLVTCLGGGALVGLAMVFRGARMAEVTPAPSVTPGVKEGAGYLKKRLVTEAQGFAPLNGLYTVDQGRDGVLELVVVGEGSAAIFDQQWRGLKAVTLEGVEASIPVVEF